MEASFSLCVAIALSSVLVKSVVEALRPEGLEADLVLAYFDPSTDPSRLVFANPSAPNPAEIGLRILIDNKLYDAETWEEIGLMEGLCTSIGFSEGLYPKLYCSAVADFGDENILAMQGTLIQDQNNQTDGVTPIVGGSGIYDGATGWVAHTDVVNGTTFMHLYLTNNEDIEVDEAVSKSGGGRRLNGI